MNLDEKKEVFEWHERYGDSYVAKIGLDLVGEIKMLRERVKTLEKAVEHYRALAGVDMVLTDGRDKDD